jgi:hypothetical protein
MDSSISPEDTKRKKGIVDLLMDALARADLEPRIIIPGRVEWLRGGLFCVELEARKGVDVAILRSRTQYGMDQTLYRIDYAVRGNIKGILPGRIISKTSLKTTGLVKKSIVDLTWMIPQADRGGETSRINYQTETEGLLPGPGEVWEGGPHQKLTELLNHDSDLIESLRDFAKRGRGSLLSLSIVSDRGTESIRIIGSLWLRPQELLATYAAPAYLGIVNRIGGHIKEVRREFGGLAF